MNRKIRLKIGIFALVIGLTCFSDWTFAAEDGDVMGTIGWFLNMCINILSWIWILLAKVIGLFLTNKWVYGEVLGLDALLWQYWNVIKNIANFCLGFFFIYAICKILLDKKDTIASQVKKILLWILIAGVGIQASWFITAAMIDVSTITLVAAGSFPSYIMSQNAMLKEGFDEAVDGVFKENGTIKAKSLSLFPDDSKAREYMRTTSKTLSDGNVVTEEKFFDALMPSAEDVSGPLFYLGFSILGTNKIPALDVSSAENIKGSIIRLLLQGGTTIVYSIELLVLCVVAIMRVIYLWAFITLSPLVILLKCIEKSGLDLFKNSKGNEGLGVILKNFNIKSFFVNIFKPTIVVLFIGIAVLFTTVMNATLTGRGKSFNEVDLDGIKISTTQTEGTNTSEMSYTTTIDTSLGKFSLKHASQGFFEIMLSIITVILVYLIVQAAMKMGGGEDFVSKKTASLQKKLTELISSAPIVPVAGYDKEGNSTTKFTSVGTIFGSNGRDGILSRKMDNFYVQKLDRSQQVSDIINSWFPNSRYEDLTLREQRQIEDAGKYLPKGLSVLEAKKKAILEVSKDKARNLTLENAFWVNQFMTWLTESNGRNISGDYGKHWNEMIKEWNESGNKDINVLYNMFQGNHNYRDAYANFFGQPIGLSRDAFKKKDISIVSSSSSESSVT